MLMLRNRLRVASGVRRLRAIAVSMPRTYGLRHATVLAGLLLASALGACGGGDGGVGGLAMADTAQSPPMGAPQPPTMTAPWSGHFVGTVKSAHGTFFGDALITTDGLMRLYVGGTYSDSGALELIRPATSEQFIGKLDASQIHARAAGEFVGQQCATGAQTAYCGQEASADLSMSLVPGSGAADKYIEGQMEVVTTAGSENWTLHLGHWPDGGAPVAAKGQFRELVAEFSSADDTVIVLDGNGALFFQSSHSGCTGNGKLAPHRGDEAYASDASLTIGNCSGKFAYLNGEYTGLATTTPGTVWDYDGLLRVWLSKPAGTAAPAALTMLSESM